jgi:hypothetical protein
MTWVCSGGHGEVSRYMNHVNADVILITMEVQYFTNT